MIKTNQTVVDPENLTSNDNENDKFFTKLADALWLPQVSYFWTVI